MWRWRQAVGVIATTAGTVAVVELARRSGGPGWLFALVAAGPLAAGIGWLDRQWSRWCQREAHRRWLVETVLDEFRSRATAVTLAAGMLRRRDAPNPGRVIPLSLRDEERPASRVLVHLEAEAELLRVSALQLACWLRLEARRVRPERERVDLAVVAERAARRLAVVALARNVQLCFAGQPGPAMVVRGDRALLELLCTSLVAAVLDRSLPGSRLTVQVDGDGAVVLLRVEGAVSAVGSDTVAPGSRGFPQGASGARSDPLPGSLTGSRSDRPCGPPTGPRAGRAGQPAGTAVGNRWRRGISSPLALELAEAVAALHGGRWRAAGDGLPWSVELPAAHGPFGVLRPLVRPAARSRAGRAGRGPAPAGANGRPGAVPGGAVGRRVAPPAGSPPATRTVPFPGLLKATRRDDTTGSKNGTRPPAAATGGARYGPASPVPTPPVVPALEGVSPAVGLVGPVRDRVAPLPAWATRDLRVGKGPTRVQIVGAVWRLLVRGMLSGAGHGLRRPRGRQDRPSEAGPVSRSEPQDGGRRSRESDRPSVRPRPRAGHFPLRVLRPGGPGRPGSR